MFTLHNAKNITILNGSQKFFVEFAESLVAEIKGEPCQKLPDTVDQSAKPRKYDDNSHNQGINACVGGDMFRKYNIASSQIDENKIPDFYVDICYQNNPFVEDDDQSDEPFFEIPEFYIDMVMPPREIEALVIQDAQLKAALDQELDDMELKRRVFLEHTCGSHANIFIINLPNTVTVDDVHLLCNDFERRLDIRVLKYVDSATALVLNIEHAWLYILNDYMFRGRLLETKVSA